MTQAGGHLKRNLPGKIKNARYPNKDNGRTKQSKRLYKIPPLIRSMSLGYEIIVVVYIAFGKTIEHFTP